MLMVPMTETIFIPVRDGHLRAQLSYGDAPRGVAVIAGPHPLMGGSTESNVVRAVASRLPQEGLATLTFDYSGFGVNESQHTKARAGRLAMIAEFWDSGATHRDEELLEDVAAAWAWAKDAVPGMCMAVGYSFGAYAVHQLHAPEPDAVVLLCPTLSKHNYEPRRDGVPIQLLFGDNDFSCPGDAVDEYIQRCDVASCMRVVHADHFLKGHEQVTAEYCTSAMRTVLELTQ